MSERCQRCKEIKCIDTTCKTCWPKKEKSEFDALMNGTLESLPRINEKSGFYPLDDKGIF